MQRLLKNAKGIKLWNGDREHDRKRNSL
jgi:hypothetical protein